MIEERSYICKNQKRSIMKFFSIFLFLVCHIFFTAQSTPENCKRISNFYSEYVTDRDVWVLLPEHYDAQKQYPVLYMHDGQMLFSFQETWNGQNWGVDEITKRLAKEEKIPEIIVVGVANISHERHSDYFPEKPFLTLDKTSQDSLYSLMQKRGGSQAQKVNSDNYLKFLVYELKPYIDSHFSTKNDRMNTFIAGSSMGGLISMYAFFEYPEIYGGAACLSTHWVGSFENNDEIPACYQQYIESRRGLIVGRKLYFDTGTETLDALYGEHQKKVDAIFEALDENSNSYKSLIFIGDAHTENDWKARLDIPLEFLLNSNTNN